MRITVEKLAVIGAGNMGSGIAQKIATEGYQVVLVDLDENRVEKGMTTIRTILAQGVERGIFRADRVEEILDRVVPTADWQALADVDLVIEAVFEDIEVKRSVFNRLGEVTRPDAILATNTSSFYVRDLAAVTRHPERLVGLHYFYHPAKNRLVEVVRHEGTDPSVFAAAWGAQEAIGKTPIASADAPGFVVNRYFVPWLNEAVRLLDEGVADIPSIEVAAREVFQIGMGPFELMNVTGVPIALHAATTLGRELGAFYAPADALAAQVRRGSPWDLSGESDAACLETVAERLLGVVFYVAAQLVDEGVATVEATDIGARVGLRWAQGPFQLMQQLGIDAARNIAEATIRRWGLVLPRLLRDASATGIPIHLASYGMRGAQAAVWLERPDAMNALNPVVTGQLGLALDEARQSSAPGIVLGGSGKAFVAGADLKFFVDRLRSDRFQEIYDFTARGQQLLARLSGKAQPVVARVHGLSLGGGSELALACDWIACSPKGSFGFPETGIGIVPGLGGCHRLARRIGLPLAKWLVYTGQTIDAPTAAALGLADMVAEFDALDAACEELVGRGPAPSRTAPVAPPGREWEELWRFFETASVADILAHRSPPADDRLASAVKRMRQKSAHALLAAERLFDEGSELPLDQALALDLRELEPVFAHPDALEGLSSVLEGRRPAFAPLS